MKRLAFVLAAPVALLLGGCVTDGYGYGDVGLAYGGPYAYDGFYDGYYGPIYDGYWGNNGYFYYRGGARDRYFRRGDHRHFYRGGGPRSGFNPMRGSFHRVPGMRTPSFPGGRGGFQGRPGGFHGRPGGGHHH